jgi:hypothetical protein
MNDYQLVIKIPISTIDDPAARTEALDIISRAESIKNSNTSFKLQRLETNQAPVGIII